MKIIVCVKQVPSASEVKIDPQTKNLMRDGVPSILNPSDVSAIEVALRIKERCGGSVTLLSMGPPQAKQVLEYGLGMGADQAVLICDRRLSGSDTLATSYALTHQIEKEGFDLILCGNETIDGCTGQVGPSVAERLNIPGCSYVSEIAVDEGVFRLKRDTGPEYEVLEVKPPFLACLLKGSYTPRPSAPTEREVKTVDAGGMELDQIGLAGSPTRVFKITRPEREQNFVDVDSSLSCEERIEVIISGGVVRKDYELVRGSAKKLADTILEALM